MTRDQYKTVTKRDSFALLVAAESPNKAMGMATFGAENVPPVAVQPVTLNDVRTTARNLPRVEAKEFDALLALRGALEARDGLALESAKARLEAVYQLKRKERAERLTEDKESRRKSGAQWGVSGLSPEESLQHIEGLRIGPDAGTDPNRLLSWAVSNELIFSQLVLWSFEGRFIPAIYCTGPNRGHAMRVALYAHTFLIAPSSEVGFRICPYDGEQFFQERPNQEYCCPAHREAHRVKRYRNEKKKQKKQSQKGVKRVSQKTR